MATKPLLKSLFLLHLCVIALLIGSASNVYAQTPAYLHYDVNDGLPGNVVYCAAQDDRGFMWFGTDKGLACFDGTRFRVFGVKDGLPDPEVLNLKKDSKGRLWIFCFRQKPCYNFEGKIVTEKEDQMLREIDIDGGSGDIYEDKENNLYVYGGGKGMYKIGNKGEKLTRQSYPATIHQLHDFGEYLVNCDPTFFAKIYKTGGFDSIPINFNSSTAKYIDTKNFSRNKFLISYIDASYIISISTSGVQLEKKILKEGGRVFVQDSSKIWICSLKGGAYLFLHTNDEITSLSFYLNNKKITRVFSDSNNGIWFCTSGEGIYHLPTNSSSLYNSSQGIISENVTTLSHSTHSNLLAGDDQGNIYSIKPILTKLAGIGIGGLNRIREIIQVDDGSIYTVSDFGFSNTRTNKTTIINQSAGKYLISSGDTFLYGFSAGIWAFSKKNNQYIEKRLSKRRMTAGALDHQKYVWSGGIDGLYSSRDTFNKNWGDYYPLLKSRIVDIVSDQKYLWVATSTEGLLKLKIEHGIINNVEQINPLLKKSIENIQSIFAEPQGRIWLATNKGVFGIDQNYNIIHFDKHNGLVSDDVNDILVYNDTLWAATVEGLSKICISNKNTTDFPTYYTRLQYRIDNQEHVLHLMDSITSTIQVYLPPQSSLIELGIAGLDYTSRGNMKYECVISQLLPPIYYWTPENLVYWIKKQFKNAPDTTGTENGLLNFGAYLAPAFYTITSKGINTNNTTSKIPAIIHLHKAPFWYQTIWFYLAIFGGIGYFFWRIFKTNLENKQLQTAVSELRLQTLQSQINPHFIGNSVNAIQQFFFPPDVVKASEYISTFTRLLRTTMDFSERPFVSIQEELAYSKDYLSMINLRFGDKFRFNIEMDESISPDTPFPSMLLQPILENATIHGISPEENSYLLVKIVQQANQKIICTITDNGVGIHQKQHEKKDNKKHVSKGISLLFKKVKTLNDLYNIHCELSFRDLSEHEADSRGTEVVLAYFPSNL